MTFRLVGQRGSTGLNARQWRMELHAPPVAVRQRDFSDPKFEVKNRRKVKSEKSQTTQKDGKIYETSEHLVVERV